MNKLSALITELCPNGVEYVPLWSVTIWDKRFNSVDRIKQPTAITYPYLLAADLFAMQQENGDVFLLSTGEQTGWTTEEIAGKYLCTGEVVTMPWGKTRPVADCAKYYRGKFVTADNRIMTSNNTSVLDNKYLYYWFISVGKVVDTFYRGSGIQHPDMAKVLDLQIPVPPLEVQHEIVRILDTFTELTAELTARKQQYAYYRDKLLAFGDDVPKDTLENLCDFQYGKGNSIPTAPGEYPVYGCNGVVGTTNVFNSIDAPVIGHIGSAGIVNWGKGKHFVTYNGTICKVRPEKMISRYAYHLLCSLHLERFVKGSQPFLSYSDFAKETVAVPPLNIQQRVVSILDRFDTLCTDLSSGLPAEIEARQKQYEYYRDKLLSFTPAD